MLGQLDPESFERLAITALSGTIVIMAIEWYRRHKSQEKELRKCRRRASWKRAYIAALETKLADSGVSQDEIDDLQPDKDDDARDED